MASFQFNTEPMDENEDVLGVFYGSRGQVGQQLVVTNRRLLFGPIDTALATTILEYGAGKASIPGVDLVKQVLAQYAPMQPLTIWLRHVVSVQPTNPSFFRPPGLRLTMDTQQVIEFGVVDTPTTIIFSPRNKDARDRAVRVILQAVEAAKAVSPRAKPGGPPP